jgi:hypothetical protein
MNDPAAPAAPAAPAPVSAIDALYGTPKPAAVAAPAVPAAPEPEAEPEADPAAAPAAADPSAAPTEGEAEEVELKTFSELAEHFELDPEWLKTLKVSEKVNGAEVQFSIEEALATHRKVQAADTYLADAKAKSKALIDESTQHKQEWASSVASVGALLQEVEADITREAAELTDKLKTRDPAMYAVKQNEIRERKEKLAALRTKAQNGIREAAEKSQRDMQAAMNQRLPKEQEIFAARVPDWNDEKKQAVIKYLSDDGFTQQEINSLAYNGRLMSYVVKAMQSETAKTKLEATKKKVVKIPKVLKPGPKAAPPKPNGAAKNDPVSILYG